jgi:hypothetical protein
MLLLGLLVITPFFLAACDTTPDETNITPTANGEKINDNTYIYYYGQTCSHCQKVEDYLKKS